MLGYIRIRGDEDMIRSSKLADDFFRLISEFSRAETVVGRAHTRLTDF